MKKQAKKQSAKPIAKAAAKRMVREGHKQEFVGVKRSVSAKNLRVDNKKLEEVHRALLAGCTEEIKHDTETEPYLQRYLVQYLQLQIRYIKQMKLAGGSEDVEVIGEDEHTGDKTIVDGEEIGPDPNVESFVLPFRGDVEPGGMER